MSEKILVTTSVRGRKRSVVWDTSGPMGLGRPFRWVVERVDQGVRIRNLAGATNELLSNQCIKVDHSSVEKGVPVTLNQKSGVTVEFKRLNPVPPAYTLGANARSNLRLGQLFAYAGVRRSLISTSPVHSAYVAYARGKPIFAVYQNPEGFRVKALLNGVRLKLKGQKPTPGKPGETWALSAEQLVTATMSRGWYWWRFNLLQTPAGILVDGKPTIEEEESKSFLRYLLLMGLFFFGALTITALWHAAEKPPEEKPPVTEVKLEPKKDKRVSSALLEHMKPTRQKLVKQSSASAAPAVQKPEENKVKEASREAQKVEKAQTNLTSAKAPAKADLKKAVDAAKSDAKNKETLAKARTDAKAAKQAAREEADKARKFQKAQELSNKLKAFSGLSGKLVDNNVLKTVNQTSNGAKPVFEGSGGNPALGKTEIKPVFNGSNSKVAGIGGGSVDGVNDGGASGAKNGHKGDAFGYGKTGTLTSLGKGGSFVSVEPSGVTVEEGLSMEEVGRVIHAHMSEVRYCQEAGMVQNPRVEGKLVLDFKIDPTGRVEIANIQSSSLPSDVDVGDCVKNHLVRWQFPHPRGGVHVAVTYPFLFKTLSRD